VPGRLKDTPIRAIKVARLKIHMKYESGPPETRSYLLQFIGTHGAVRTPWRKLSTEHDSLRYGQN